MIVKLSYYYIYDVYYSYSYVSINYIDFVDVFIYSVYY